MLLRIIRRTPRTMVRPRTGRTGRRSGLDPRGQSLVEFSMVLPVMLAIVGVVVDAARLYQAWTVLESGTRDAAQYLARSDTDPLSDNYTIEGQNSDGKAIYILDTATGMAFDRSPKQGELTDCSEPQLTTTFSTDTSLASGGTVSNPVGTATVSACVPFQTLFSYPFLTTDGAWILESKRTISVVVGR